MSQGEGQPPDDASSADDAISDPDVIEFQKWKERKAKRQKAKSDTSAAIAGGVPIPQKDWEKQLIYGNQGLRAWDANLNTLLANHPLWKGALAWDDALHHPYWTRKPPFHEFVSSAEDPTRQVVTEADVARVNEWFQRYPWCVNFGISRAITSIEVQAQRTRSNPLREWLVAQEKEWDGRERMRYFCRYYLGADPKEQHIFEESADPMRGEQDAERYLEICGHHWLLSGVARVLNPGCQVDHVLLLEGDQGLYKTSALAALVPEKRFALTGKFDINDEQKTALMLNGKWITILEEGDVFKRASNERIKHFITERENEFVPKYKNLRISVPRTCVFAATFNPRGNEQYLTDESGNRRWWPIFLSRQIDVSRIMEERHQIWAEAVHIYNGREKCLEQGALNMKINVEINVEDDPAAELYCRPGKPCAKHRWWPDNAESVLFQAEQGARLKDDPWMYDVAKYLRERSDDQLRNGFTASEALDWALKIEARDKHTQQNAERVGRVLARLGFVQKRVGKNRDRKWVPGKDTIIIRDQLTMALEERTGS